MEIVLMEYIVSQEVNQGIRLIYKEVRKAQKVMRLDQASWHPAHYGANQKLFLACICCILQYLGHQKIGKIIQVQCPLGFNIFLPSDDDDIQTGPIVQR